MTTDGNTMTTPPPECTAHGWPACAQCSLNPANCTDGGASGQYGCHTYSEDGMHWDTCGNRVAEILEDGSWRLTSGTVVPLAVQLPVRKLDSAEPRDTIARALAAEFRRQFPAPTMTEDTHHDDVEWRDMAQAALDELGVTPVPTVAENNEEATSRQLVGQLTQGIGYLVGQLQQLYRLHAEAAWQRDDCKRFADDVRDAYTDLQHKLQRAEDLADERGKQLASAHKLANRYNTMLNEQGRELDKLAEPSAPHEWSTQNMANTLVGQGAALERLAEIVRKAGCPAETDVLDWVEKQLIELAAHRGIQDGTTPGPAAPVAADPRMSAREFMPPAEQWAPAVNQQAIWIRGDIIEHRNGNGDSWYWEPCPSLYLHGDGILYPCNLATELHLRPNTGPDDHWHAYLVDRPDGAATKYRWQGRDAVPSPWPADQEPPAGITCLYDAGEDPDREPHQPYLLRGTGETWVWAERQDGTGLAKVHPSWHEAARAADGHLVVIKP